MRLKDSDYRANTCASTFNYTFLQALRMNRTLLSLSLAQNQVTDIGATELATALKCFPLTHEEVVERRKLKSDKVGGSDGGKSPPPSRRADSKDRPGSHRSNSHLGKDKRDKSSKKKVRERVLNTYTDRLVLFCGKCIKLSLYRMKKLILKDRRKERKILIKLKLVRRTVLKEAKVSI